MGLPVSPRCAGLVDPIEGAWLRALARAVPASQAIVEIGSHTGLSTCWMAEGTAKGARAHITAIDPWGDPRPGSLDDPFGLVTGDATLVQFLDNLTSERAWGHVTPLRTFSEDAAKVWVQPVGLLFIDAVHTFEDVRDDYLAWERHLRPGSVLALHDYNPGDPDHPYAGVSEAVDKVIAPTGKWTYLKHVGSLWTAILRD